MLKHRIIPTLLHDGYGQCVKPVSFKRPYRKLGPMSQYIKVMERRGIDEIILLDIQANSDRRQPQTKDIKELTSNLFCPVTVGGGISTLEHIQNALASGADKVAIKTNINIIPSAAEKFGSQAIVGVVDVHEHNTLKDAMMYCSKLESMGVGEILLTDIQKDGTLSGYNLDLIRVCSDAVRIPVVSLGGCRDAYNMVEAIRAGASAVAAGSLFLYTDATPQSCAEELHKQGIPVRLHG